VRQSVRFNDFAAVCARQSVPSIDSSSGRWPAGLLLSALQAGDIDRQLRAPVPRTSCTATALSSNGAAARRSAANAGSVMLTAEGRG